MCLGIVHTMPAFVGSASLPLRGRHILVGGICRRHPGIAASTSSALFGVSIFPSTPASIHEQPQDHVAPLSDAGHCASVTAMSLYSPVFATVAPAIVLPAIVLTPKILLLFGGLVAFCLSAALGANDVANSLGTAVGTGAIKVHQALAIGAVMEFAGAVLFGSTVTQTISSGVVSVGAASIASPVSYMLGMCSVLVGCTVWMAAATRFGLPVSSTHSVVGALIGLGIVSGWGINYLAVQRIVMSWFLSPLIGAMISTIVYKIICATIVNSERPARATRRVLPFIAGIAAFVLTMFVLGKGARFASLTPERVFYMALGISFFAGGLARALSLSIHSKEYIARKFGMQTSSGGSGESGVDISAATGYLDSLGQSERSVAEQREDVERIFKVLQGMSRN